MTNCPVCASDNYKEVVVIPSFPVLSNVLYKTKEEAKNALSGRIQLVVCEQCGHFYNKDFDIHLVEYSEGYENALHHSQVFQVYQQKIAEEIARRFLPKRARVLEIGCGQGDFLIQLLKYDIGEAIGYDPSFRGNVLDNRVSISPNLFRNEIEKKFDIAIARHVLEHLDQPSDILNEITSSLSENGKVYLEVPNAMFTIEKLGIWDLIYEHRSYFTSSSLQVLMQRSGLVVDEIVHNYEDQFLSAFGHKGVSSDEYQGLKIKSILLAATRFREALQKKKAEWNDRVEYWNQRGEKVFIWGSGSKGCTFANIYKEFECIQGMIDINPIKKGRFVAGAGLQIYSPEHLTFTFPGIIIIMNPIYQDEITNHIKKLGIKTRLELAV